MLRLLSTPFRLIAALLRIASRAPKSVPFRWAARAFLFLSPQGRALRRSSWIVAPLVLWLTGRR
jgi:hypothetical protein